jgi:hypothetical protein
LSELRKIPDTSDERLLALWHAIIGTNGEGLIEIVRKQGERFEAYIVNRQDTCYFLNAKERGKRRWGDVIKTVISLAGWASFGATLSKILGWW